jgi:hypothetical protein
MLDHLWDTLPTGGPIGECAAHGLNASTTPQLCRYLSPNCTLRNKRVMTELRRLQEELNALLSSWEYAFAMGHGCSIGDHPRHRAIRQQAAGLRARIAELTE